MIINLVLLFLSAHFIYLAYGLWKYRDIKKYGNRDSRAKDIKDVDGYIKWWIKWNIINGGIGIIFVIIEITSSILGIGPFDISLFIIVSMFGTLFYSNVRQKKFLQ